MLGPLCKYLAARREARASMALAEVEARARTERKMKERLMDHVANTEHCALCFTPLLPENNALASRSWIHPTRGCRLDGCSVGEEDRVRPRGQRKTATELPDSNPKTVQGLKKDPMHFVPTAGLRAVGRVMRAGATKYGPYNWRDDAITATIYYDAAMRHLMEWLEGRDADPDDGEHPLAHVAACCMIVLDAIGQGCLNDDRPGAGEHRAARDQYALPFEEWRRMYVNSNTVDSMERNDNDPTDDER